MKSIIPVMALVTAVASPALGQGAKPASMDELLQRVKSGWKKENVEAKKREQRFIQARDKQQALLDQAEKALAAEERRGATLEKTFQENETRIAQLEEQLQARLGNMGELFGVIRQVAGDTRGIVESSMVSAEFPNRTEQLAKLAESKALPSLDQLEGLWYTLQQEMIESGRVVRFRAPVVVPGGEEVSREVVRVGVFNAVSAGKYLQWLSEAQKLAELGRQPPARYVATAEDLQKATSGYVRAAVDPSRGSILSLLVQTPSLSERLSYGGAIGYIILSLGAIAVVIALIRLVYLFMVGIRVRTQRNETQPNPNNPLGRVMKVYADNPRMEPETLELKLDEAIVRETATLERFLWAVKVVSVVAPLMGLLGTVTGMIQTFQSITLFGTGDPKLMASGISEALVTTMLGLVVAIPLVLLHSWLSSLTRNILTILNEQSAGVIAARAEKER